MTKDNPFTRKELDTLIAALNEPEVKQNMVDWANRHSQEIARVSSTFYMHYGQAMDGWSVLEGCLSRFFSRLTRMPPKRAARIFFSARSFNGRADMFEAALSSTRVPKELRAFLKTIIKTARIYSGFRNQLAHGEANLHVDLSPDGTYTFEMLITEPKYLDRMTREYGVSVDDLKIADHAFRALAGDMMMALDGEIVGAQLEEHRALILQRPKLPSSKGSHQNAAKQKSPPRSSRA